MVDFGKCENDMPIADRLLLLYFCNFFFRQRNKNPAKYFPVKL